MILKYIHLSCVTATFVLFFIRGIWMMTDSSYLQKRWTRVVPPVIDTLLLVSAVLLAVRIQQYPFVHGWLTAKVIALFAYIGLGMLGLTYGKTKTVRITCWFAALVVFGYIVSVAMTRNPLVVL